MTTTSGSKLKHAIIGVGAGVFNMHRPALELEAVKVVGVSDINTEAGQQRAKELGCPFYTDHKAMLLETKPDVAVILTPHPSHASLAIDCLQAGTHVLVEKPIAVHAAEARGKSFTLTFSLSPVRGGNVTLKDPEASPGARHAKGTLSP